MITNESNVRMIQQSRESRFITTNNNRLKTINEKKAQSDSIEINANHQAHIWLKHTDPKPDQIKQVKPHELSRERCLTCRRHTVPRHLPSNAMGEKYKYLNNRGSGEVKFDGVKSCKAIRNAIRNCINQPMNPAYDQLTNKNAEHNRFQSK